jgi:hypothetical protein
MREKSRSESDKTRIFSRRLCQKGNKIRAFTVGTGIAKYLSEKSSREFPRIILEEQNDCKTLLVDVAFGYSDGWTFLFHRKFYADRCARFRISFVRRDFYGNNRRASDFN